MQKQNDNIKSFFSILLISIFLSVSYAAGLMAIYFIKYNVPAISGGEWYPIIVIAVPALILILIVLFMWFAYGERNIRSPYATLLLLAFLILPVLLGATFPEYKYSPQRVALRLTGIGGKTVYYSYNNASCGNVNKRKFKAYMIFKGNYFYYFKRHNGSIGINRECIKIYQKSQE